MTQIPVEAFTLKDINLTIGPEGGPLGTNDYAQHVSRARFDPTTNTTTWKPLSPNYSHTSQGVATWTCALAVAQDWDNANSLANFLLENEGAQVPCSFEPAAGGASFTATLVLAAPAIGGDVDTTAVAEVVCGVIGKPVRVPPA